MNIFINFYNFVNIVEKYEKQSCFSSKVHAPNLPESKKSEHILTHETTTKPAECGAAADVKRLPVERLPNYHISD